MSPGGWALRGERTLWTGRPAHARITGADAGFAVFLAGALVVLAFVYPLGLRGAPGIVKALGACTWGLVALQLLAVLAVLLVTEPRKGHRTVYEVTNYRVIVSWGPGADDATSVYLDQLDKPTVRPGQNGTGDVLLGAGSGDMPGWERWRAFLSPGMPGPPAGNPVTVLRAVPDAGQACQVIAEARRLMRDGEAGAPSPPARRAGPAVPGEIALAPGEDVLWTGGPAGIPWWFGGRDVYLTAFGLVWLAFTAAMGVLVAESPGNELFLAWLGLIALVGVYPGIGRVVHRRLRIGRSRYVLTSRRLITTWRPLGGGPPVVVQASLGALLPPVLRGTSVITGLAAADGSSRQPGSRLNGWKATAWPAATVTPPVFIGLADAQEVAGLIGDAQVATRAPGSKPRPRRAVGQ